MVNIKQKGFLQNKQNKQKGKRMTYSWSKILSGGSGCCEVLYECENLVFFNISMTSEFLLISSPSFSPEVKWAHTKQKVVPCNVMLIDIEPCLHTKNYNA